MSTSTFIEQLAAGHAADAKETLSNLLSARAFESLDARKKELGATLFGSQVEEEVEGVDESMDQPMSKILAKGYTSSQDDSGDKAPRMSDKQKAAAKAARDARDAADMKKLFAKFDAKMRKSKVEEEIHVPTTRQVKDYHNVLDKGISADQSRKKADADIGNTRKVRAALDAHDEHGMAATKYDRKYKKEEVEQVEEGTMTGITLGQKVKNKQGGYNQDVHHKGEKIGHIEAYKHRTGMRYGSHHDASGDGSAGNRSPEESIDDIRFSHAQHLKDTKVKK